MMKTTLYIVSCSAKKTASLMAGPCPAREAYAGQAFRLARAALEQAKAKWCILSGGYGILWPDTVIEYYDAKIDPDPTTPWDGQFDTIKQKQYGRLMSADRVVVLGSRLYAQSAAVMLGRDVEAPLAGLPIGKMLRALKQADFL